jgi:hypothetical protein
LERVGRLAADRDEADRLLDAVHEERVRLAGRLERLTVEADRQILWYIDKVADAEAQLQAVHQERDTLKSRLAAVEEAQRQILTSRFWRMTAPLRTLWQWVGGLR